MPNDVCAVLLEVESTFKCVRWALLHFDIALNTRGSLVIPRLSYLCLQTKLDLVHQDETVGHEGLRPVQNHTTFNLVTSPIGHFSGDVVCFAWETHNEHLFTTRCRRRC